MIQDIFVYNNQTNRVELNTPEILLVKEFSELLSPARNKCKEDPKGVLGLRAFREFTYIWLAICWKSIYSEYDEQERHLESLKDANLTEEEFNNPEFRAACRKFKQIQESNLSIKMLKAAQETVNKFIEYFNSVDPLERDEMTGKPVSAIRSFCLKTSANRAATPIKAVPPDMSRARPVPKTVLMSKTALTPTPGARTTAMR